MLDFNNLKQQITTKTIPQHKTITHETAIINKHRELSNINNNIIPSEEEVTSFLINPQTNEQYTPSEVKVIIVGQDPYTRRDYACGPAFCHNQPNKPRGSGRSAYVIMECFYGPGRVPGNRDAMFGYVRRQGVMMVNSDLTTVNGESKGHEGEWRDIVRGLIDWYVGRNPNIVVLTLGSVARRLVGGTDVFVFNRVEAHHPTCPGRELWKSGCFEKVNEILVKMEKEPIEWECEERV